MEQDDADGLLEAAERAQRLAKAVRYRRVQLGYHPRRLWPKTARLSEGVIRKIESGRFYNYRPETLINLELDLEWPPGTVDRIWSGLDRSA